MASKYVTTFDEVKDAIEYCEGNFDCMCKRLKRIPSQFPTYWSKWPELKKRFDSLQNPALLWEQTTQSHAQRFRVDAQLAAEALKECKGLPSLAAEKLRVPHRVMLKEIELTPSLQELVADQRDARIDRAEKALDTLIANGTPSAVYFVLSTLGKKRGYAKFDAADVQAQEASLQKFREIQAALARPRMLEK